jgi:hypothetical protein
VNPNQPAPVASQYGEKTRFTNQSIHLGKDRPIKILDSTSATRSLENLYINTPKKVSEIKLLKFLHERSTGK